MTGWDDFKTKKKITRSGRNELKLNEMQKNKEKKRTYEKK